MRLLCAYRRLALLYYSSARLLPLLAVATSSLSLPSLSPPPLRSSRPPASSCLLPPLLPSWCYRSSGSGYVIIVLGVSLPPLSSSLLSVGCLSTTSVYLPPLAPSSFPHFPPYLVSSLVSFTLPVPPLLSLSQAPTSSRLLPPMGSPCFGVGCRWSFGFFGGGGLYPLYYLRLSHQPILRCSLLPLASALLYTHPHA